MSHTKHARLWVVCLLWTTCSLVAGTGWAELFSTDRLQIFGDFRSRLESDFDSARADSSKRDDRLRLRARARIGLGYNATDHLSFGLRLRSGSDDSHQSPHITLVDFDNNDTGDVDFNLDRWFLKGEWQKGWAWTGRNGFPFWKQNEFYWDDDATLAGAAAGIETAAGKGSLEVIGGYFSLPVGMKSFAGNLSGVQLVYDRTSSEPGLKASVAWLGIEANTSDVDAARLLSGNGLRDYSLLVVSAQLSLEARGRPLVVGADLLHNSEDYSANDPDPVTAANHDQTDGFVLSLISGRVNEKGDWLAGYYYARIETLAVQASYAQDDWLRWGSATETRASNFKGHELRFGYGIQKNVNLIARLFLVDSITTREDGKRFRVDLNIGF